MKETYLQQKAAKEKRAQERKAKLKREFLRYRLSPSPKK